MWTHFEVVSTPGNGHGNGPATASVPVSASVSMSGPDPAPDAAGHCGTSMFYVQVFNIVFDEVISICCLMNCNGWFCHQITIALLEFH